jgi:CelD/BcsL family acetyltransferase involved in cellulose biosynthesis
MTGPEVVRLGGAPLDERLRADWLALAGRLAGTSYFQTPDWVLAWWETVGGRPETDVAAWRGPSGGLDAVVALSRGAERLHRRLPLSVPVLVNAGTGPGAADHCGWLVAPQRRDDVRDWLATTLRGRALLLRAVDVAAGAPPLPAAARVVETVACPRLPLPATNGPHGPSPAFSRQLARLARRLARDGVRFAWHGPGVLEAGTLDALYALHERARGGRTTFRRDQLALHRAALAAGAPGRGPAALVATRGGEVVGVLYGFRFGDTFAAYQCGWDARLARDSIGSVLIAQALEALTAEGARWFDFLRGGEAYKARFHPLDGTDRTWLVPGGAAGRLLAAGYVARRHLHVRAVPRRHGERDGA